MLGFRARFRDGGKVKLHISWEKEKKIDQKVFPGRKKFPFEIKNFKKPAKNNETP